MNKNNMLRNIFAVSLMSCSALALSAAEVARAQTPPLAEIPGATTAAAANALRSEAIAALKAKDYPRALTLLQQRLHALTAQHGEPTPQVATAQKDLADAQDNYADALYTAGKYAEALPLYRQVLAERERRSGGASIATGVSLNDVARALEASGLYPEAEPLYVRALTIAEKTQGPDHPATGTRLNNLALLYKTMGQYAKAEPLYVRALAIAEKAQGPDHPSTGTSLNNLALLYKTMSQYAKAEPLYVRALAVTEKALGSDHPTTGIRLNNLAVFYKTMGEYAKAEPYYVRALAITEKALGPDHPTTGIRLNNLALFYKTMGQYAKAEPFYARALAITEKALGSAHPSTGIRLNNLALLYQSMGQYAKAEPLAVRALAIAEKAQGPDHPATGSRLSNLAGLYRAQGLYAKAEPLYVRALRVASNAGNPEVLWNVQSGLMHFHAPAAAAATRNLPLAIYYGKQAVNTLQSVRGGMQGMAEESQQGFLIRVQGAYEKLADLLIEAGRLAEAHQVLAMLKEEEYHEFTRGDAGADARATRAGLSGTEQQWNTRYQQIAGQLFNLAEEQRALKKKRDAGGALSAAEDRRLNALEDELDTANRAYARTLDELKAAFTALASNSARVEQERRALDESLTGVVDALGAGVVLLHTVSLPDHLRLLITHAEARKAHKVNITDKVLNTHIDTLVKALKNPRVDPRPAAAVLYDILIRPIEADLQQAKATMLMVSLDGALRYVPMGVLYDGKQYLAEKFALSLYTEAARASLKDTPRADWRVAALGVSKAHGSFSALPAVLGELATVVRDSDSPQGSMPGQRLLDEDFTAQSLRSALSRNPAVVHVASHFKFAPSEQESFLLLGDGQPLSLTELRQGRYTLDRVDLLTLSACDTAVTGGTGSEVEGLAVTAQKKGAKAVLATLWSVADASTATFMQRFYQLRDNGKITKAEAIRLAQIEFIQGKHKPGQSVAQRGLDAAAPATPAPAATYAHPFFWAPFILMGNWR